MNYALAFLALIGLSSFMTAAPPSHDHRGEHRRGESRQDHGRNHRHGHYHQKYGHHFKHGYFYKGQHHNHWLHQKWSRRHGCTIYYDGGCKCYYYWCGRDRCYYPVHYRR